MQIILLESLNKLGKAGDIVTVKDGFANNFLIPQKKAIVANKKNRNELNERMIEINANNQKKVQYAEEAKSKINGAKIEINMEANDDGILYGSITQKQIAEILVSKGAKIESEMILLAPIKSLGEYEISIRHYEEVKSQINVVVSKKV